MHRWQPIETAPKAIVSTEWGHDYGERVLAALPGRPTFICRWWKSHADPSRSNFIDDGGNAIRPKWWQPLPAAPSN